jgi:glyoxylase-like metal-dependent hydrolase (beta-lactamase superfamily II)
MVRIDYICHSCILVTTPDTSILFDPWLEGTSYSGQWYLYPKAIGVEKVFDAQHIVLTHGHDDHMHRRSLEKLNKAATVWFPYQWRAGIERYMRHLGFAQVQEAVTLRAYQIGVDTRITYLAYSLESIVILETGGLVIVNLNDALNSNHENVVMMFLQVLRKIGPRSTY